MWGDGGGHSWGALACRELPAAFGPPRAGGDAPSIPPTPRTPPIPCRVNGVRILRWGRFGGRAG
eukprot:1590861-Pyramimonas_sp.AAC.1